MGGTRRQCSDKYHDGRVKATVSTKTSVISNTSRGYRHIRKNSKGIGEIHPKMAGKANNKGDFCSDTIALFSIVHETKEKWETASNNRFVSTKSHAVHSAFQNGDSGGNRKDHHGGTLGVLDRHRGCIFSCPDQLGVPQVHGVQSPEPNFRFSIPALRSFSSSLGFHENSQTSEAKASITTGGNIQLHRRLHSFCSVARTTDGKRNDSDSTASTVRIPDQLGEISVDTLAGDRVPWRRLGSTESDSVRSCGQKERNRSEVLGGVTTESHDETTIGTAVGEVELCSSLHSAGENVSASSHDLDEPAHDRPPKGSSCVPRCSVQGKTESLGEPGVLREDGISGAGSSESDPNDRCISGWLVRGPASSTGYGHLGSGGGSSLHELEGDDGSVSLPAAFQVSVEGEWSPNSVRQHGDSLLPEETGFSQGSKLAFPDNGDSGILQSAQDSNLSRPHSGSEECPGRPRVQGEACRGGMVFGCSDFSMDQRRASKFGNRLVCDTVECTTSALPVSVSGCQGGGVRCLQQGLERVELHLPVSTGECADSSGNETPGVSRVRDSGCSAMGGSRLVSSVEEALQDTSFSASQEPHSESDDFEGFSVNGEHSNLEPSRLATIRSSVPGGCSSDTLGMLDLAHRASTVRQYQAVWQKFITYLDNNGINHGDVTLAVVMNFLSYNAVYLKRQYRTIAAYKCALELPLKARFGLKFDNFEFQLFMRGIFNSNPPQRAKPIPTWSLDVLLSYLNCDVFEPLFSRSMEVMSKKLVCLLLLATGRRVSEICALSMKHKVINQGNSLQLYWLDEFKPKHYEPKFKPKHPIIDELDTGGNDNIQLCPIRAFNIYVNKVNGSGRHSGKVPLWKQDIADLTELFNGVVTDSFKFVNLVVGDNVGPHQMRKFAASYSHVMLLENPALERRLLDRMGFASMVILKKNYVDNVPDLYTRCVLPVGTFIPSP